MSVPTWSGDEHTLGNFRYRVLWFRVLLIAGVSIGLTGSFAAGYKAGERAPRVAQLTAHKAAAVEAQPTSDPDLHHDCVTFDVLEFEDDEPSPSISAEAREALLADAKTLDDQDRARIAGELAQSREIKKRLHSQNISLNFDGTPFSEGIDFLRDITQLNFVVTRDAQELVEDESVEISLRLKNISLVNAINLILASNESLAYRIQEGVIVIHTFDELPEDLVLEVYVVRDIVAGETRQAGGFALDADALIELLETCGLGDEGSLEYQRGTLIVRKSAASHPKIRKLLAYLRGAEQAEAQEPAWIKTYQDLLASRKVTLNFAETPLSDVVSFLQDITGLNITIGSGVNAEETIVSIRLREVLLEDALRLILEQADLGMSYRNQTLLIEQRYSDAVCGAFTLEILDVRDLRGWLEPDTIVELVTNAVGEDLWDDPASIQMHRGQLILQQTANGRAAVKTVLAKLRVSRAKSLAEVESGS
ncbi:MAG: hypothetical protein JKY65_00405 [Planctomycetes bacterium]|nr:hypothetical protein [Planctomycetota bacterium]